MTSSITPATSLGRAATRAALFDDLVCASNVCGTVNSDQQMLKEEVEAWEAERNGKHAKADWQFTTADARVKLKRLYPAL
jgi:hypothetical protein